MVVNYQSWLLTSSNSWDDDPKVSPNELLQGYRRWADVAAELFGGLDILTVDAIIEAETGKVCW